MSEEPSFQVTLGEFSGPLDLLCHLVESSAMEASSVRLTDVLAQYVSYMLSSKKSTLSELAEFFSLASRLLLRKVRSLLPRMSDEPECEDSPPDDPLDGDPIEMDEEALRALMERFRPYRNAAVCMSGLKERRERHFARISDEGGPPWFDIGDLYGLSTLWWSLIAEHSRHRSASSEEGFMMEIPDAVPEEILVERRMDEVLALAADSRRTTLRALLKNFGSGGLIVTLLALLELSRLGKLSVVQNEAWGDVEIAAA